jgi:hypothetical protein
MSKPTIREIYIAGLKAVGSNEVPALTSKYIVFLFPSQLTIRGKVFNYSKQRIYLGKSGAFRVGRTATSSFDAAHSIAPEDEIVRL